MSAANETNTRMLQTTRDRSAAYGSFATSRFACSLKTSQNILRRTDSLVDEHILESTNYVRTEVSLPPTKWHDTRISEFACRSELLDDFAPTAADVEVSDYNSNSLVRTWLSGDVVSLHLRSGGSWYRGCFGHGLACFGWGILKFFEVLVCRRQVSHR